MGMGLAGAGLRGSTVGRVLTVPKPCTVAVLWCTCVVCCVVVLGLPLTPDGSCPRCGAMHHTEVAAQTPGHDFKQFYKQTSPVKRQTSADLGI